MGSRVPWREQRQRARRRDRDTSRAHGDASAPKRDDSWPCRRRYRECPDLMDGGPDGRCRPFHVYPFDRDTSAGKKIGPDVREADKSEGFIVEAGKARWKGSR